MTQNALLCEQERAQHISILAVVASEGKVLIVSEGVHHHRASASKVRD